WHSSTATTFGFLGRCKYIDGSLSSMGSQRSSLESLIGSRGSTSCSPSPTATCVGNYSQIILRRGPSGAGGESLLLSYAAPPSLRSADSRATGSTEKMRTCHCDWVCRRDFFKSTCRQRSDTANTHSAP